MRFLVIIPFLLHSLLTAAVPDEEVALVEGPLRRIGWTLKEALEHQSPFLGIPDMGSGKDDEPSDPQDGLVLSDVFGQDREVSIFASLTRSVESVSKRLEDQSTNSTVLAPSNAQMNNLERKPWEDPKDYETFGAEAYKGSDGEDRAQRNLRKFVEAHIVTQSPMTEDSKVKTMNGNEIWVEVKDGKKIIRPGNIEVDTIAEKVSNGEVWVLKNGIMEG